MNIGRPSQKCKMETAVSHDKVRTETTVSRMETHSGRRLRRKEPRHRECRRGLAVSNRGRTMLDDGKGVKDRRSKEDFVVLDWGFKLSIFKSEKKTLGFRFQKK